MSKKGFHPSSSSNRSRVYEAEVKAAAKKKQEEEKLAQYLKEQELFQQRSLVSKESKEKLSLSFMYDQPAGTSHKSNEDDDANELGQANGINNNSNNFIPVIKKEKKEPQTQIKPDSDSEDSDEPKITLKWKRQEPRSKKPANNITTQPIKKVKKEDT